MTPLVVLLVLMAASMHAVWNALVKTSGDRLAIMVGISAVGGIAGLAVLPFAVTPAPASWPYLALTTAIHIGYYLFLLRAYGIGDLSQVYPIARGGSPLILALISGPVVGEALSVTQAAGVGLISLGIISLSLGKGSRLALFYAVCTACFIAAYSATDALGVLSVITGFFGMNFDFLPLIHSTHGLWLAVGLMAAIATGLLVVFWRKRYLARTGR